MLSWSVIKGLRNEACPVEFKTSPVPLGRSDAIGLRSEVYPIVIEHISPYQICFLYLVIRVFTIILLKEFNNCLFSNMLS